MNSILQNLFLNKNPKLEYNMTTSQWVTATENAAKRLQEEINKQNINSFNATSTSVQTGAQVQVDQKLNSKMLQDAFDKLKKIEYKETPGLKYNREYYEQNYLGGWSDLYGINDNRVQEERRRALLDRERERIRIESDQQINREIGNQWQQYNNQLLGLQVANPVIPATIAPVVAPKSIRKDTKEILEKDDRTIEI